MTPEQQRIAIAKACGWTVRPDMSMYCNDKYGCADGTVPDYLNDLNAMHEAEPHLGDIDNWLRYDKLLAECATKFTFHATAAQRAEAFLRTLNLWTT